MNDKISDTKTATSPWVNSDGFVAHPDAPSGGGGPGHFSCAPSYGCTGNDADPIPHPMSPEGRCLNLTQNDILKLQEAGVPLADAQSIKITTKVTVNISETVGPAITFNAKNYAQLYQQVKAREDSGEEAGRVTASLNQHVADGDLDEFGNVSRVTYTIILATSLPKWTTITEQSQENQNKFNNWHASVVVHEKKHVDIYKTGFARLKTEVKGPKEADLTSQSETIDVETEEKQDEFDNIKSNQPAGLPAPGGITKVH